MRRVPFQEPIGSRIGLGDDVQPIFSMDRMTWRADAFGGSGWHPEKRLVSFLLLLVGIPDVVHQVVLNTVGQTTETPMLL